MPKISERTRTLGTETAFVVLAEVNRLIAEGKDVTSFCIGQPDFTTPENIREAGIGAIRDGKTGYTPSAGIPALREAVAKDLSKTRGIEVAPEHVVVAAGAKPFIGYTILATTDPGRGDEVIYPTPGFPIYESLIRAYGCKPVALPLREGKGFAFDVGELEAQINDKTKLLILNSPQNPTGGVLGKADLARIAELAHKHDLWVYSDEIYSRIVYDAPFASIASETGLYERTVVVDGASKTYAMTGWRIGWAANPTLAPRIATWVTNTESCAGHMNQVAAVEAVAGPQEEAERFKTVFAKRRDRIVQGLNDIPGISCVNPGGAFYVWPNVTELCQHVGAANSEDLRKRLLHEAGVAVLADIHFGTPVAGEGQHIRFSYATSEAEIAKGLERVAAFARGSNAAGA